MDITTDNRAFDCHRDVRMDGGMMRIPGTLLVCDRPEDNGIRLPGDLFQLQLPHCRMPWVSHQDETGQCYEP